MCDNNESIVKQIKVIKVIIYKLLCFSKNWYYTPLMEEIRQMIENKTSVSLEEWIQSFFLKILI